ncbi:MAG: hypothetical protein FJ125_09250 [Deltaproteobacteria bacterium]|nr:hypothetical protein [Deltaproteobacteria bacterium]
MRTLPAAAFLLPLLLLPGLLLAQPAPPPGTATAGAATAGMATPPAEAGPKKTVAVSDPLLALLGDYERELTPRLVERLVQLQDRETIARRLRALAADGGHRRYLRLRATAALAFFPGEETTRFLARQAETADDPEVRLQSVITYGHACWAGAPDQTSRWLAEQARSSDPRIAAAARRTRELLQGQQREQPLVR